MPSSAPSQIYTLSLHDALPIFLLVDADRVRYGPGLAAGVVHHRVEVGDVAQAVAAQRERRGHEAQAPLADVERGPPVVVRAGVPRSEEHTSELQSLTNLVCRLLPPPRSTLFPYTTLFRSSSSWTQIAFGMVRGSPRESCTTASR